MNISEYKNIYDNESTHFYYVGYHEILLDLISKITVKKKINILDAGCGTGLFTKKLGKYGRVIGIDMSDEAIKFAKSRKLNVKKASVTKLPFKVNTFDLIVCNDVLCHKSIPKEETALKEFYRVLSQDGLVLIKLPAFDWLMGSHDRQVHTKRRYEIPQVEQMLKNTGFTPVKSTYIASFLLPLVATKSLLEKITGTNMESSGIDNVWGPLNKIMLNVFRLERTILKYFNLPFGITLVVVAKKN